MKEFIKKYWKDILLIVFLIVVVLLLKVNNNTKNEVERWQGNYHTAIDSVNVIKTKNDELIYERDNFRLNYEELDKQSQQEIKKLEKELNKQITYISKLEANIKIDTLIIKDSVYINDGVTHIAFNYKDDWFKISGSTILDNDTTTSINNIHMLVPLTLGLSQDDNISSIFVTTENPYVSFTNIEGTDLSNTPQSFKHWRWSAKFGFDFQYGILNKTLDNSPYIETG
jgi:uncharacterized lipoprotein YehR (DUF1307 family)